MEVLEDLMANEAEATRARRLSGRLRFTHYPLRKTLGEFEFDYQPSVDRNAPQDLRPDVLPVALEVRRTEGG